jgi:hypothetical protein
MSASSDLFLAHCPNGHLIRATFEAWTASKGRLRCGCGRTASGRRLEVSETPARACGSRCWTAHGLVCDCACLGQNHGTAATYSASRNSTVEGEWNDRLV